MNNTAPPLSGCHDNIPYHSVLDGLFEGTYGFEHVKQWLEEGPRRARHLVERMKQECGHLAGKSFLDIGCQDGAITIEFARQGCSPALGIDINESALDRARVLAAEQRVACTFKKIDFLASDIAPQSFDIVVANDVLEHVESHDLFFQELARVLRPHGSFYLKAPNRLAIPNIKSDPHFRMFGVCLLSRFWGKLYVKHLRRKINPLYGDYHVGYLPTYNSMRRYFRKWGLRARDLADEGWFRNMFSRALLEFIGTPKH